MHGREFGSDAKIPPQNFLKRTSNVVGRESGTLTFTFYFTGREKKVRQKNGFLL